MLGMMIMMMMMMMMMMTMMMVDKLWRSQFIFNPCGFLYIALLGLLLWFFQVKICKSGLISRWRNVSIGCVSHSWLLEVGCVYYVYYEELKFHIFIDFT
mgnify:CR=1 FL=1